MRITIKLFATLRNGLFDVETRTFSEGTTVAQVIGNLGIPEALVTLVFINGRHGTPESVLEDGDVLSLFPPVGGG
jgi:sulfur-carrier protein